MLRQNIWSILAATLVAACFGTAIFFAAAERPGSGVAHAEPGSARCLALADEIAREEAAIAAANAEIATADEVAQTWHNQIEVGLQSLGPLTGQRLDAALTALRILINFELQALVSRQTAQVAKDAAVARLRQLLEAWQDPSGADCGPPPISACEAAGVPVPNSTSASRSNSAASRRAAADIERMRYDLLHPIGPAMFGVYRNDGTIGPIGSESGPAIVDSRTNLPIILDPEQTTLHAGATVLINQIDLTQTGSPSVPVVRITGTQGQAVVRGVPGAVGDTVTDFASYMGSMFVLPTTSSASNSFGRALPLIVTVGTGAALLWRITRLVGSRALIPLNALFMAIDRIQEMEEAAQRPPLEARNGRRRPQCGFHVVLTVRSQAQPVRMSSKVSKSDAAPPASEPAPTPTPPGLPEGPDQDLSSGGGDGVVSYAGSTCGRATSEWTWHVFVGLSESGRGGSALLKGRPGTTRARPLSTVSSFNNLLDKSEVDWSKRETRDIWDAYVPRLRDQIKASLSGITTRLSDVDRIGSGRPTYMIFKHPQARQFRVQIRPGCDVTPPQHYLARDVY